MDPETIGRLGGWLGIGLGAGIGILGAVIGTYLTMKNTRGPRERAFAARAFLVCWALVVVFVVALMLIPTWHKYLLWIPYAIGVFWGIRAWNRTQLQIRQEESEE